MKAKYMPKTLPQTLGYLVEECGEVMAAVGKTIRWGEDGFNPELPIVDDTLTNGGRETNREWILRELLDLENAIARTRVALGALAALPLPTPVPGQPGRPESSTAPPPVQQQGEAGPRKGDVWQATECGKARGYIGGPYTLTGPGREPGSWACAPFTGGTGLIMPASFENGDIVRVRTTLEAPTPPLGKCERCKGSGYHCNLSNCTDDCYRCNGTGSRPPTAAPSKGTP